MELFLNDILGKITIETDEVNNPRAVIILAHGSGAGMHHPFMVDIGKQLNKSNINCIRFNFPYMEQGKKFPGSLKHAITTWGVVINHVHSQFPGLPIFMSGKSYGGRMGSHYLAENESPHIKGIIYFGFPLHAPGKDSKERANHLSEINKPQLFLQGKKDKLANIKLINEVVINLNNSKLVEMEYADHSFKVPKKSGLTREEVIEKWIFEIEKWI